MVQLDFGRTGLSSSADHQKDRKIKSDCPKITFEKRYGCHKRPTDIGIASVMGENFRWAGG